MNEVWKDIDEYKGIYMVSNWGNVKSLNYNHTNKERILKPGKDAKGYLYVILYKDSKRKKYKIHRLVAMAFLPNTDNLIEINHKDEDKTNNNVSNLEWCERKYNVNYGTGIQRRTDKQSKIVYQYTMNGEFIREWRSAAEVKRQLGYAPSNICKCCNGKLKAAYGYIWSYIK